MAEKRKAKVFGRFAEMPTDRNRLPSDFRKRNAASMPTVGIVQAALAMKIAAVHPMVFELGNPLHGGGTSPRGGVPISMRRWVANPNRYGFGQTPGIQGPPSNPRSILEGLGNGAKLFPPLGDPSIRT
jgi:hypothetical protein